MSEDDDATPTPRGCCRCGTLTPKGAEKCTYCGRSFSRSSAPHRASSQTLSFAEAIRSSTSALANLLECRGTINALDIATKLRVLEMRFAKWGEETDRKGALDEMAIVRAAAEALLEGER